MKVLHVLRSDGFAGVERHVAALAASQAAAGRRVVVVGGDQPRMRDAVAGTSVQLCAASTLREALAGVRRFSPGADIVHAHMTAGEVAAVVGSCGMPIIATRHFAGVRGRSLAGQIVSPWIGRRLAAQIAISHYVAGTVDGAAEVVYAGVPDRPDVKARRERIVLVAQRLQEEKETDVAIRAFAMAQVPGWKMQIAGEGTEREALRSLVSDLGVADSVDFLGRRSDVDALMRRASVLVSPCRVEGLGLAVLEAMSHALPVIASDSGAHPETVGRASHRALFPAGDSQEAAARLTQLCVNEELRRLYGAELQNIQRDIFSLEQQVAGTDRIYRKVLQ